MMDNQKYSVVSLFSGAGGFDWGFHRTGRFQTYLACEILPEPAATLARNLELELITASEPISPQINGKPFVIHGDIQYVDFSQANFCPDVLIGGPPCQDFSITISKKNIERPGLNGGRGSLYVEFVRALMFFQPKIFVFENVPGLISANERAAYPTILSDLQNLEKRRIEAVNVGDKRKVPSTPIQDYEIIYKDIVDTPHIGVPQTRRRLIIVGVRHDLYNSFNLMEQQQIAEKLSRSLDGHSSPLVRFPLTSMEILEGRPLPDLQAKYKEVMLAYEELSVHPQLPKAAEWRERVWNRLNLDDIRHDYFLSNQIDETEASLKEYEIAMELHCEILRDLGFLGKSVSEQEFSDRSHRLPRLTKDVVDRMTMIPPDENHEFVKGTPWEVEGKDISFIYRRAAPLKPAWTVMAYGGGGTYGYHYERSRSQLTLRERARIQTFTDDFIFEENKVRAQIGEAVPPLLGQRIGENIVPILESICLKSSSTNPDECFTGEALYGRQ